MNKKLSLSLFCLFLLSLLVLPGCWGRKIHIKTKAYADTSALPYGFQKQSVFYVDGVSVVDGVTQPVDELETKELKKKVSLMLVNSGYQVADKTAADYHVRFNYGCRPEKVSYNVLKCLPGKTYTSTTTVVGTSGVNNYDQTTTTPDQLVYVTEQHTVYSKFLDLHVYDKKGYEQFINNKMPSPHLWYGFATGTDEYDDLRTYLDYLLVAVFDAFGDNDAFETTMDENDKSVKLLREQMFGRRGRR